MLLAGLGLRLIIAYVLLPGSGFGTDIASFTSWAMTLAEHGPGAFYEQAGFADYPPGYLYVLWLVGLLATLLGGPAGADAVATELIKIPPILADVAVGWLLWDTLRAWVGGERGQRLGLVAAALYLFNPVTWYDSAIWGQVDAVGALVMLAAVRTLTAGWSEGAAVLTVLAGVVKPQFGIVIAPIVGAVLLRRHLLAPGSGPRPARMPERLAGWFSDEQGPWRLVSSAAVGLVTLIVTLLPFGLSLPGFVVHMARTAGGYPFLSVNAYNPWALVAAPVNGQSLAQGGGWSPDVAGTNPYGQTFTVEDAALIAGLPGVTIGTFLLAIGFLVGVLQLLRRSDRRSIVLVAIYLSLAFFVLPTRVHERYLFPVFAFLPIVAAVDRRWLLAGAALALFSFVNLHGVLTTPAYGTENVVVLPLGDEFRTPVWITLSSLGHLAVFLFALLNLRSLVDPVVGPLLARIPGRRGEADPAAVLEGPAADPGALPPASESDDRTSVERSDRPAPAQPGPAAPGPAAPGPAAPGPAAPEPAMREPAAPEPAAGEPAVLPSAAAERAAAIPPAAWWTEELPIRRRSVAAPGPAAAARAVAAPSATASVAGGPPMAAVARLPAPIAVRLGRRFRPLRRVLAAPPVRADRTASLFAEGGGRFGRLDLFILALVVVAALTLRTWRLAEPYGMHFDEVYHARTATEFLQHWRYGLRHDIYEFTHPHLAKYLIAAGIVAAGNNRVTAESELGMPVADALVERRWSGAGGSGGDALWVADGAGETRAWSLAERVPRSRIPGTAGAVSLALDPDAHVLYGADASGTAWSAPTVGSGAARELGELGGRPLDLVVSGSRLLAALEGGRVASLDTSTGERTEAALPGAAALVPLDGFDRLVAEPAAVADPPAVAARLAELIDDDAGRIEAIIAGADATVTVVDRVDADERDAVDGAIASGELPGLRLEREGTVAVAYENGVAVRATSSLEEVADVALAAPATGAALVKGVGEPTLYVAAGPEVAFVEVPEDGDPQSRGSLEMPGDVRDVRWNESTQLVHVLGVAPDGSGETVYVIEPHGNAVYADAGLPLSPIAWAIDEQPETPSVDRQELLAVGRNGSVAVVDVGSNAFGWRIPGVIAGVAMTALLYVLARILFARREVAVFVAAIGLLDGMFFAQSRIAMNDSFVGLFIVGAYTAFAAIYLGRWRGASALLLGMPLVGLLLGLGLATKWVSAYAIGGIALLILLRSALGRLIALAGMVAATGALGWLAIVPPDVPEPQLNFLFLFLMIALTILLAATIVARPIRLSLDEARFALAAPAVLGIALAAAGILIGPRLAVDGSLTTRSFLAPAVLLLVAGALVYALLWLAGRAGLGPLSKGRADGQDLLDPPAPAPRGWLRPGWRLGIPWLFALLCLAVVPVAVYVVSYIPWAALGNRFLEDFPAGHTGQLFVDLQRSMYDYHNNLRATHAASSPWWAWLLDLKPVWFYSEGLGNNTTGLIYDAGNLVLFWLSAAALPWAAWQAWRRRSLALGLVVLAFLCQWLPWARIDRATFQYHVYTSLPFAFLALAYFLGDLWHGPSRRTWLYARLVAAVALLGPALLWLGRAPLCAVSGVERVNPGSEACGAVQGQIVITDQVVATLAVLAVGLVALLWQLRTRAREVREAEGDAGATASPVAAATRGEALLAWAWMAATVALTAFAVVLVQTRFAGTTLLAITVGSVGPYVLAAVALGPLLLLAWIALGARDSRRYVVSTLVAATVWLVLFYPHIAAVPMPNPYGQAYLGLLPTWNYDFQFAVNTDPPVEDARLVGPESLLLMGGVGLLAVVVMYAVWSWRLELAARRRAAMPPGTAAPD